MAQREQDNISKRKQRRYRRKLKKSVKIAIVAIVIVVGLGSYSAIRIYNFVHSENPYGKVDDTGTQGDIEQIDLLQTEATYEILSVGNGESIFIKYGDTEALIDTGGGKSEKTLLESLSGRITGKLDYLIITSPSAGRTGNVGAVANKYEIGTCILGELGGSLSSVKGLVSGRAEKVIDGENLTYDFGDGVTLFVIKPEVSSDDPLDRSLVTYFTYSDKGFVALSDAGKEEIARALSGIERTEAIVLARNGNEDLLSGLNNIVQSHYYIASASKSSGFPTPKAEELFSSKAFSTGDKGTIKFIMSGTDMNTTLDSSYKEGEQAESDGGTAGS